MLDDHTRRALCIEVDSSLPTRRVTLALERAIETYGKPALLRTDNAPEFRDRFAQWCTQHNIHLHRIAPGKPTQNALIERFSGTYRREVLDAHVFENLHHARLLSQQWLHYYNAERPHSALNHLTPNEFFNQYQSLPKFDRH
ncbi:MAG: integrase core domain-containing protein [Sphingobacteriia bacterium]